jgi:hypothetical protein
MTSPQHRSLAEGVFVASKKRQYSEYVFDIDKDENGNICKRKPGRRGPLDASTLKGIETVKQEGGACWRCKILKKPVGLTEYSRMSTERPANDAPIVRWWLTLQAMCKQG